MGHLLIFYTLKKYIVNRRMSKMTCVFEAPFVLCVFMIDT